MSLSFIKAAYALQGPDVLVGALIAVGVAALFKWIRDWREHLVALLPFVVIAPLVMRFAATIPVSEPHHPDAVMVAKFVGLGLAVAWVAIASKAYRRWRKVEIETSKWWKHLAVYIGCASLISALGAAIPTLQISKTDGDPVPSSSGIATPSPYVTAGFDYRLYDGTVIHFDSSYTKEDAQRYLMLNFDSSRLAPPADHAQVDKKREELIETLIAEAKSGRTHSQVMLAGVFASGRWLQADQVEATRLYLAAASAGDVESQAEMGYRLSEGRGTAKDIKAAIEWTTKAANAGNTRAQQNLGFFSQRGVGMLKDEESAYFWYLLAAAGGSEDAAAARDEVEQRLSPEQRAAAQQRAKDWKPSTTGN